MENRIKSKKLGGEIVFTHRPDSYIFIDFPDGTYTRICEEGLTETDSDYFIRYSGNSEKMFNIICRNWYLKHIKTLKDDIKMVCQVESKIDRFDPVIEFKRVAGYHIYAKIDSNTYCQICYNGNFHGEGIVYGGKKLSEFTEICKNWLSAYLQNFY